MEAPSGDLLVTPDAHVLDVPVLVRRTHDLLASGVPLTLLIDLADEAGPHSTHRYETEGGDADWLPKAVRG